MKQITIEIKKEDWKTLKKEMKKWKKKGDKNLNMNELISGIIIRKANKLRN